jgi:hypothetical protein
MHLYVMDDGTHLMAEEADHQTDPLRIRLTVSGVVRYWGTTRGRGELCIDGPTEKTKVDVEPEGGTVNWLHVRRSIAVTVEARKKWLKRLSEKKP